MAQENAGGGPTRVDLAVHHAATLALRVLLRLRPREHGEGPVRILLMHAWGMGGTIRTSLNVAGYLAGRRDVEVLSIVRRRGQPAFDFPPGVRVTAVDDQRARAADGRLKRVLRRHRSLLMHPADRSSRACSLYTDLQLVRTLWRIRSGVLVGTRPALNLLALDAAGPGLTVVGEEHMHLAAQPPATRNAIRRRYRGLDALVVLTDGDRLAYRELLGDETRIVTIPNAAPAMPGPPSPLTAPTLLAVGRLRRQKGFDTLIRSFARIARDCPDWTLRICGGGPWRSKLEELVVEQGLEGRVVLSGRSKRIAEEMENASIYVLSSRFEGFPMVMIEAMSKGLPVVSFACPTGPREILRDGVTGLLVPDQDEGALAVAMLELIRSESRRRELGMAGVEEARRYSLSGIGPRWDKLFADLAETAHGPLSPAGPPGTLRPARREG